MEPLIRFTRFVVADSVFSTEFRKPVWMLEPVRACTLPFLGSRCAHPRHSWLSPILFGALALVAHAAYASGGSAGKPQSSKSRAFTVADSIGMTHIVEPNVALSRFFASEIRVAPNGQYFAFVTRSGNLQTGRNEFALIVYNAHDVLEYVNSGTSLSLPAKAVLVRVAERPANVTTDAHKTHYLDAFRDIRWLSDSRAIAFIGRRGGERDQVYRVAIETGELKKLTNHPTPIESFDVNAVTGDVVYASSVVTDDERQPQTAIVVGAMSPNELINFDGKAGRRDSFRQIYLIRNGETNSPDRVIAPFAMESSLLRLSPDGRHAIALTAVEKIPPSWLSRYEPLAADDSFAKQSVASFDENTMAKASRVFRQFALLDLANETATPIFDAPVSLGISGYAVEAAWLPDGKSAVLANTFLPLNGSGDEKEVERRRKAPAVVEYNTATKRITHIVGLAVSGEHSGERFTGLELSPAGVLAIHRRSREGPLRSRYFRKEGAGWREIDISFGFGQRLALSIHQGLNTPPEILSRDIKTRREKIITDLNPQFRRLTFGKLEKFKWTDVEGRNWLAGLLYPPTYQPGRRYPLVIQTHGFHDEFLVDGPDGMTSAYAAQALANRDIMVLQMPDRAVGQPNERQVHLVGTEGAITKLDGLGLIDTKRMGAIGFSGSGHVVYHLVNFSTYRFAAATVADAFSMSYFGYVAMYGSTPPGMLYVEQLNGGVPWGMGLQAWIANNPVMHTDRIHTPIRFEDYGRSLFGWWDVYAILRRQQKPTEFLFFPEGEHVLTKPLERLVSQQGNVDWYDFWLNGREDSDAVKAEQYKRWRELRALQRGRRPT